MLIVSNTVGVRDTLLVLATFVIVNYLLFAITN